MLSGGELASMQVSLAIISRVSVIGLLFAASGALANPIDDCNQGEDPDQQIQGCTEFLPLDPLSPYVALAYGLRGAAYRRKGDLDRALADLSQSLDDDPNQVRVYVNRGIVYSDKGYFDRAIADFTKAMEVDSQFAESYVNRCVAYLDKGNRDAAIADCDKAIAINPNDAVAYNDRGAAHEKKGDLDQALADYTRAVELDGQ